jgi:eukaryotic-like serine/threonine-protein kinase
MNPDFLKHSYSEPAQLLGGRYRLIEQLGSGGFGQTFKAQDLHLPGHPFCVVKQLNPKANGSLELQVAERLFETEAQVLYRLGSHPQIPRLMAHFEENKEFYLVQELIEGDSLEAEFTANSFWKDIQVVDFLNDILETLAFIHKHGVIHRDLKPSNLIRRQSDNRIVVIDFGAVKQVSQQLSASSSKISHTISIGTQGYMPNEQIAGQPRFSSDLYAVGMIALQALTGQHPSTINHNLQTGELEWQALAPSCAPNLIIFLNGLLRYDFRSRYIDAGEALVDLRSLFRELGDPKLPIHAVISDADDERIKSFVDGEGNVGLRHPDLSSVERGTSPMVPDGSIAQTTKSSYGSGVRPQRFQKLAFATGIGVALMMGGLFAWREYAPSSVVETPSNPLQKSSSTSPLSSVETERPLSTIEPTASIPQRTVVSEPVDPKPIAETVSPSQTAESPIPSDLGASNQDEQSKDVQSIDSLTSASAQNTVESFYRSISAKNWDAARAQFSGKLAEEFEPSFYQQFQQISVEKLRVLNQSAQSVDLIAQNTYIYPDESTQQEERTYLVRLIDGQPYITDSSFVRIIKARSN